MRISFNHYVSGFQHYDQLKRVYSVYANLIYTSLNDYSNHVVLESNL